MLLIHKKVCLLVMMYLVSAVAVAQSNLTSQLIYSVRLTFQTYGLPFQNIGASFRNVGAAVEVGMPFNKSQVFYQTLSLGYQGHQQHETSIYVNTQFNYRPLRYTAIEPSIAVGIGRMLSFSNSKNPYYSIKDGIWDKSHNQKQGHWQVPVSLSLGYRSGIGSDKTLTPFVGYDIIPVINYNSAFIVLPYSVLSVGTRARFQSK